ncbi:MAG: hypothetical protein ABW019_05835, partial [Chitinophagaceae bacterium]
KKQGHAVVKRQLLQYDQQYTKRLNRASVSLLPAYFSTQQSLAGRDGHRPYQPARHTGIMDAGVSYRFEQTGGDLSTSETMGYTYGTVKISTRHNGETTVENKCFLRIWQRMPEWKIVLDVIGGN